jgi:hypothetical protein
MLSRASIFRPQSAFSQVEDVLHLGGGLHVYQLAECCSLTEPHPRRKNALGQPPCTRKTQLKKTLRWIPLRDSRS